jgi:endonuclease/exonuclease/phosphatase family metal-dependent hydrolase
VLAGDFNMDLSAGDVAKAIRLSDFQDAFINQHTPTTPNSFFTEGRVIDWIFSRGPLRSDTPQVHHSASGSDHYPLSVTLDFR